jgi:LacI family transcriptional regulator
MEKSKHPTLTEVARKAGVGTTTVSRVINGGDRVSPKTLARVLRVIETLGYSPNQAARTLKGHRTKTIGLVIPSIADPFFSSCAEAAQAVARANDSLLIVTTTQNDPHAEIESLDVLIRHRTDGLLIAPADSHDSALRDLLKRVVIPVVAIDRPVYNSMIASVVADNFQGANIATRHLIEHGYKRIVCLTGESTLYTIRERINGYREAIEGAGLECLLDTSVKDYKSTEDAIKSLLFGANPPDAIFALKNSTTIYAFEALQKLNVSVPDKVALLGFDDFELASTVRPSISVIEQPVEEMARIAAELLFKQLLHGVKSPQHVRSEQTEVIKLETRLIRRSSCGCVPNLA